jgi:hypothetical protein
VLNKKKVSAKKKSYGSLRKMDQNFPLSIIMKCRQVYIHRTVKLINLIMDEKQIKE